MVSDMMLIFNGLANLSENIASHLYTVRERNADRQKT